MKKISVILIFLIAFHYLPAQTFKIFKGDTINRVDSKGLKQGLWRKYYNTDTLFSEGIYKNNIHTGTFNTFHKNGKIQSILKFRGTTEISKAELFYESGKIMSKGKYIDHTKDSLWIYYDEEGIKNAEEFYKNGKKEGTWIIFYQNGKPSRIVMYKSDKKNGPFKEFFESGRPKIDALMKDDEFEGIVKIYHPNGQLWQSGNYSKGLKEGSWKTNLEDGTQDKEEIYIKGILTNPPKEEK